MGSPDWSAWRPLAACWACRDLTAPGLYRIRRAHHAEIDYIGQTSGRLRDRLGMLRGALGAEMPYRDPHTAAPALWAQCQITNEPYEASTLPVEGDRPHRKAVEAVAIALYRQEHRRSPTFNFGRMPLGYRMSSANNAKLVARGKRFRGGLCDETLDCHLSSLPPSGLLDADASSQSWCGHDWSDWAPVADTANEVKAHASGLYRIRGGDGVLVYVGEGVVRSRLIAHLKKALARAGAQGNVFAKAQPLECSWVVNADWAPHQREELETDLIAACTLASGSPPVAQFIG